MRINGGYLHIACRNFADVDPVSILIGVVIVVCLHAIKISGRSLRNNGSTLSSERFSSIMWTILVICDMGDNFGLPYNVIKKIVASDKPIKMTLIDKLAWIEIKDKTVLSTRSYGKDKYYIPGGKREKGETDGQALIREIKEELNVELDKNTLQFVGEFKAQAHGHPEGTIVQMTCYTGAYTGTIQATSEIEEVIWLTYADKDKIAPVDKLIFDYLKGKELIS